MDDRYMSDDGGSGFIMGLVTGTVLGAGLALLLAPKTGAELRGQLNEQAQKVGSLAADQYKKANAAAAGLTDKGREFVDRARDAASRGADDARGYASSTADAVSGAVADFNRS